jgi:hypothetical protein
METFWKPRGQASDRRVRRIGVAAEHPLFTEPDSGDGRPGPTKHRVIGPLLTSSPTS